MYSKLISFLIFFVLFESLCAQKQMKLNGRMPEYVNKMFWLLQGDEGGVFVVDSARVDVRGNLHFQWNGNSDFYRISGTPGYFDVRITEADFHFELDGNIDDGEFRFSQGDENNQFYYYLSEFRILNREISRLQKDLYGMNEKDSLYTELEFGYKKLQKKKKNLLKDLWRNKVDFWTARFAIAQQELLPDFKMEDEKYQEHRRKHFFDYFRFSDSLLVGTPIFYEKISQYLKLYRVEEQIASDNNKKIKETIENLFWLSEPEPTSQKCIANYLMNRFPEEQYPSFYHMAADAYKLLNACEYVLSKRVVQKRRIRAREIKPGWIMPDISLHNSMDGRLQSLGDVNSDATLLVVWSANCVHSKELLTRIDSFYEFYKELGLEVVAISIDRNLDAWTQSVIENNYSWVNACDTQGLKGTLADELGIYVTPMMFFLDPSLQTIGVPQSFFQLEKMLENFFR